MRSATIVRSGWARGGGATSLPCGTACACIYARPLQRAGAHRCLLVGVDVNVFGDGGDVHAPQHRARDGAADFARAEVADVARLAVFARELDEVAAGVDARNVRLKVVIDLHATQLIPT
jgi:hypothetical protein